MKSVGSFDAKTHLAALLSRVEKGETITITKRGKPVARLVPAEDPPKRQIATVIREFRAYSKERGRTLGALTAKEIKRLTEEGRP